MHVSVRCHQWPEDGISSLDAEITGGYEITDTGAWEPDSGPPEEQ